MTDVWKVHHVRDKTVVAIYVFSGGGEIPNEELFATEEYEFIETNRIPVHIVASKLYMDDTIRTLKLKIASSMMSNTMSNTTPSIETMYLFGHRPSLYTVAQHIQSMGQDDVSVSRTEMLQFLYNLGIDPPANIREQPSYTSQDLLDMISPDILQSIPNLYVPLGHQFERQIDYRFVGNPYVIQDVTDTAYTPSTKNPLYYFDTHLLLNYTPLIDHNLYLCLADEVYAHAFREFTHREHIDDAYLTNLYFPLLTSAGILDQSALQQKRGELETATRRILESTEYTYMQESVDLFYSLSEQSNSKSSSGSRSKSGSGSEGVQSLSFVLAKDTGLKGMVTPRQIPLEAIFKTIHATAMYPWIVYHPGPGRDKQIRLFAAQTAKTGQRIPVVPESDVTRLKRDLGRLNTIGMYLKLPLHTAGPKQQSTFVEVYVELYVTGNMRIRCPTMKTPLNIAELNQLLYTPLHTLVEHIHAFIKPIGYELPQFIDLSAPNVQIQQIKYVADIDIRQVKPFSKLTKYIPCITSVFDVYHDSIQSKGDGDGISMRFKRVELFRKMDAISALLQDMLNRRQPAPSPNIMIEILQKNYPDLSDRDAINAVTEFLTTTDTNTSKQTQIHAGFLVKIQWQSLKQQLNIEVSGIHRIDYLNTIRSFLHGMVYLTQQTASESRKCPTAPLRARKRIAEEEVAVPIVIAAAAAVAPAPEPSVSPKAVKPLAFGLDYEIEEAEEEELDEDALEHENIDEDDDYAELEDFLEDEDEESAGASEGKTSSPTSKGGRLKGGADEEEDDDEMAILNKTQNYVLDRMKSRDAPLFVSESTKGNYNAYSRLCAANAQRQPVILTDEEKANIDEKHPGSYSHALKHGSDAKKQYWYICPRYWSIKTNSSLTQSEVDSGKYGMVIPKDPKKMVPGKPYYIYEFNHEKQHRDKDGQYVNNIPGFLAPKTHPDGLCVPCCFKSAWEKKDQKTRRETCALNEKEEVEEKEGAEEPEGAPATAVATSATATAMTDKGTAKGTAKVKYQNYVLDVHKFPLPNKRMGIPPMAVQRLLGFDVIRTLSTTNSALIQPGTSTIVRYGVEMDAAQQQSILGIVCELYAHKHQRPIRMDEMRTLLTNGKTITLDRFVQYHHGSLVSVFRPKTYDPDDLGDVATKYRDSRLYQSIQPADEHQMDFLEESIAAYEQFLKFLGDARVPMDHTYLWDMITEDNPLLMPGGFNLILLEMPENDDTDNVELICPTNSKEPRLDPARETVVVLRRNRIYESLYVYEERDRTVRVTRTFLLGSSRPSESGGNRSSDPALRAIQRLIHLLDKTSQRQCAALPSQPSVYRFARNIDAEQTMQYAKDAKYTILCTVRNYKGMCVGIVVSTGTGTGTGTASAIVMIPTAPSVIDPASDTKSVFFDDATTPLWTDYQNTTTRLRRVHTDTGKRIPCLPALKVVEDGLVVGVLTQTNQMVRIDPPVQVDQSDLIDGATKLPVFAATTGDMLSADKRATAVHTSPPDQERTQMVQRIAIETRMYQQFRMLIKQQFQRFEHRRRRQRLNEILTENTSDVDAVTYRTSLTQIRILINELTAGQVDFQDVAESMNAIPPKEAYTSLSRRQASSPNANGRPLRSPFALESNCIVNPGKGDDEDTCKIVLPLRNLVTGADNRVLYPMRISDELLRYRRIRLFLLDPNYYLNLATVASTAYDIAADEILVLEPSLTPEFLRGLVPLSSSGNYVQHTNYDTAVPATTTEQYVQRLTTDQQRDLIARATQVVPVAPLVIESHHDAKLDGRRPVDFGMNAEEPTKEGLRSLQCILNIRDMIGGTHGAWKKSFPSTTREIEFAMSSPECFFSPLIYVLTKKGYELPDMTIRNALIAGYTRHMEMDPANEDNIRHILTQQGKSLATKRPRIPLTDLVSDPAYYLTDLDLWIVCQELNLPVILFSSTKLKHMIDVKWLYLASTTGPESQIPTTAVPTIVTPLFFLRSPPSVPKDTPPTYSILAEPYAYGQLKNVGAELKRGFDDYRVSDNVKSLSVFLQEFKVLARR